MREVQGLHARPQSSPSTTATMKPMDGLPTHGHSNRSQQHHLMQAGQCLPHAASSLTC